MTNEADDQPKHDWTNVDSLVRRNTQEVTQSLPPDLPLSGIESRLDVIRAERLGIIGKFKAGQIEKRAALNEIEALTGAQLEATTHALKRAVEVDRERVNLIAQRYIYQITEEYLGDMRAMGIHNYQARFETLLKLNDETAKLLKQAEAQDVPVAIRQRTVEAIMKKYEEFSKKLTAEEVNLR
jgi:hypothetical protein